MSSILNTDELKLQKDKIKKVFFYRVCGTGMGSAACLAAECGLYVEGADAAFYPPMSQYLQQQGIKCLQLSEVDDSYLEEFDLIIVGNSVAGIGEQAKNLEKLNLRLTSFPAFLGAFILDQYEVIGVAGTHGKTTTSYLLVQPLWELGEDPGYLIGGVIETKSLPSSGKNILLLKLMSMIVLIFISYQSLGSTNLRV